ncbi:peptidylprolyl isomerase [Candidatus Peregrinibacteria bacterium]|nr:peptidylprolyl isomerase [Candidatus Peregrinibacteria bacterium]
MKFRLLAIILVLSAITACGSKQSMNFDQKAPPRSGERIAVIKTNKGVIKIQFFPQFAPETVKNFTELAKKGFYNGLKFHRVIPDFMIQGGDPLGTGTGGETYKGSGTTLKAEISDKLKHIRGAVSMARRGGDLNSATSQFFIVQNKNGVSSLDGQYTVFGQAFEGLDVVDVIANVKRDSDDVPLEDVIMESVVVQVLPYID